MIQIFHFNSLGTVHFPFALIFFEDVNTFDPVIAVGRPRNFFGGLEEVNSGFIFRDRDDGYILKGAMEIVGLSEFFSNFLRWLVSGAIGMHLGHGSLHIFGIDRR